MSTNERQTPEPRIWTPAEYEQHVARLCDINNANVNRALAAEARNAALLAEVARLRQAAELAEQAAEAAREPLYWIQKNTRYDRLVTPALESIIAALEALGAALRPGEETKGGGE